VGDDGARDQQHDGYDHPGHAHEQRRGGHPHRPGRRDGGANNGRRRLRRPRRERLPQPGRELAEVRQRELGLRGPTRPHDAFRRRGNNLLLDRGAAGALRHHGPAQPRDYGSYQRSGSGSSSYRSSGSSYSGGGRARGGGGGRRR